MWGRLTADRSPLAACRSPLGSLSTSRCLRATSDRSILADGCPLMAARSALGLFSTSRSPIQSPRGVDAGSTSAGSVARAIASLPPK